MIIFRVPLGELITHLRKWSVGFLKFEAFEGLVERGNSSLSMIEKLNIEIARSRIKATSAVLNNDFDALSKRKEEIDGHTERLRAIIHE